MTDTVRRNQSAAHRAKGDVRIEAWVHPEIARKANVLSAMAGLSRQEWLIKLIEAQPLERLEA